MTYVYEHPKTGEIKEIEQGMNDIHEYWEGELKWNRIFTVPKMNIDTQLDPFSAKDFVRKTGANKGTLGDLFDRSAEMAEKRKDKEGVDRVVEQEAKKYNKETGLKHHSQIKKLS